MIVGHIENYGALGTFILILVFGIISYLFFFKFYSIIKLLNITSKLEKQDLLGKKQCSLSFFLHEYAEKKISVGLTKYEIFMNYFSDTTIDKLLTYTLKEICE